MSYTSRTTFHWLEIDRVHLEYLKSEDVPAKLDIRKNLESHVREYLCLVPQENKFVDSQTMTSLVYESALSCPDFTAYKAALAFEALEKYAANIYKQPWREEFREIREYGGFYKHNVEGALYRPERVFHRMGYASDGKGKLILNGPVNKDRVVKVARDCVLASVECKILVTIAQGVTDRFPCSWSEIIEFRQNYVGSPESVVRNMIYVKSQNQFTKLSYSGIPSPQGTYPLYQTQPPPFILSPPSQKERPNYSGRSRSSSSDGAKNSDQIPLTIKEIELKTKEKSPVEAVGEDWGYVYKKLENLGYTKDQGERPDILALLSKAGITPPSRTPEQKRPEKKEEPLSVTSSPAPMTTVTLTKTSPARKLRLKPPPEVPDPPANGWECANCTFINEESDKVCQMCYKSRITMDFSKEEGPPSEEYFSEISATCREEEPLGIGCFKCTLLNPIGFKTCEACGATLPFLES